MCDYPKWGNRRLRLIIVRRLRTSVPFVLIWGRNDPYLHVSSAEFLSSQLRHGALHAAPWSETNERPCAFPGSSS